MSGFWKRLPEHWRHAPEPVPLMSTAPLTVGRMRLQAHEGVLQLELLCGTAWRRVVETGPAAGVRLRTDHNILLVCRDVRTTPEEIALVLTAEDMVVALAATPRAAEPAVDVSVSLTVTADVEIEGWWSDWRFRPDGQPLDHPPEHAWVPHLRPEASHIISDHAFRAPALTVYAHRLGVVLRPNLHLQAALHPLRMACDYRADGECPVLSYGVVACEPEEHMFFRLREGLRQLVHAGTVRFGYTVYLTAEAQPDAHPLILAADRTWRERPDARGDRVAPQTLPWAEYARAAYPEILRSAFVKTPQAGEGTGGVPHWIYPEYIAFQCWFNNLRSAYGLVAWGEACDEPRWVEAGQAMRRLWEHAPRGEEAFVPTYYRHTTNEWVGVADLSAFGPAFVEAFGDPGLLKWWSMSDACWSHLWGMRWLADLEGQRVLPADTAALACRLAREQAHDGSVPSFFDWATFTAGDTLRSSAQTALAVWLWTTACARRPDGQWLEAARRGGAFLCEAVVPGMRYHDFETFQSCARKAEDFHDPYTQVSPHNTLSMQWTVEALRGLWELTGDRRWLDGAVEALACLCLYQQVWDAPFLGYDTYGGFGVMNTDAEWSDARQAQFAATLFRMADVLGERALAERAVAALRASFTLMAVPENRSVAPLTYQGQCPNWPQEHRLRMFAPELRGQYACMPTGHMIENYGHTGLDTPGVRTAFDWGEGSALSTAAEITHHYGHVWVRPERGWAVGIDGWCVDVESTDSGALAVYVRDGLDRPRDLIICADGPTARIRVLNAALAHITVRHGRTFATVHRVDRGITVTVD